MLLLTLASSPAAHAYEWSNYDFQWQEVALEDPLFLNTSSFPAWLGTEDEVEDAYLEAVDNWNTDAGADFRFLYGGRTTALSWGEDHDFIVQYDSGPAGDTTLATTSCWFFTHRPAYDCDIEFYDTNGGGAIDWSLSEGRGIDFVEVATHELGHILGLTHSEEDDAIMFPTVHDVRELHSDDIDGILSLYGPACDDIDGDGTEDCHGDCDDGNPSIGPAIEEECDGIDNNCDGVIDGADAVVGELLAGATRFVQGVNSTYANVYTVDRDGTLVGFSQKIDVPADTRIVFNVYVGSGLTGPFNSVAAVTSDVVAGNGWFDSPAMSVQLKAGEVVMVGAGAFENSEYFYDDIDTTDVVGLTPSGRAWLKLHPEEDVVPSLESSFAGAQSLWIVRADHDQDGLTDACGDCDDDDVTSYPGADELCDGVDNDCDGLVDEDFEEDSDGDGQKDCADPCPYDADDDADEDGLCADVDPCPDDKRNDKDGDGICEPDDPCPKDPDNDADGDGSCVDDDPCPNDPDDDLDGDGVCADADPCPEHFQDDPDGDGICGPPGPAEDSCPADSDCEDGGCSCATGAVPSSVWMLGLVGLLIRRQRVRFTDQS
jgi:MYXO-CTERM domain-containing protein